jgi:glycyl-tRNA synthetase beta chain
MSLSGLLGTILAGVQERVDVENSHDVMARATQFLRERLTVYLREQGIRYDLVDAALAVGVDDVSRAEKRAQALRLLQPRDDFLPTVVAATRPINIAKDFEGGDVDPSLFQEDAERELWTAYQKVSERADAIPLAELFDLFSSDLRAPIDRYFDDVLVMTDDEKLRRNRLALCWQLTQLFRRIADFSLVVQT